MLSITIIAGYLVGLRMLYQAAKDDLTGEMGLPLLLVGTFGYAGISILVIEHSEPSSMFDLCYSCKSMWWVMVGILGGHLVTKWRMERFQ